MSIYLHMGHESWSLIEEAEGGEYSGIVLSPVNDDPTYVKERLGRLGSIRGKHEVILDPQLYNPPAEKGKLPTWPYYTSDYETANRADEDWWTARGQNVVDCAADLAIESICSPAPLPRSFTDEYYRFTVEVADKTFQHGLKNRVNVLLTAIVKLTDLTNPSRAFEIASILTSSKCDRIYLIFFDETIQQREPLKDQACLATASHMIRLLSSSMNVHVAFCAHDLVLWKLAGAQDISTGKWMNVRRFTPGRWQEDDTKGRQVSYWNEDSLLTLIRDQEVLRLDREKWFDNQTFHNNPASARILDILRAGSGAPWQKLSWLQYLRWASNVESEWRNPVTAENALIYADKKWGEVESKRFLFADRFNNGSHIRCWLNAAREGLSR